MSENLMIAESAVREALAPVLDWFQSDEEAERPLVDILRDVVQELVADREDNLKYQNIEHDLRRQVELSDSYGGPRVDEFGDRVRAEVVKRLEAIRTGSR